jgi:hypothetical protein
LGIPPNSCRTFSQLHCGRWMTPGILPFALRAGSLRDPFKFAPGEFVEPPKA